MTRCFRKKIYMKLVYQYMTIFFIFLTISNHLHPLQVENCGSNSRLVVDEDDNGKLRPGRVELTMTLHLLFAGYVLDMVCYRSGPAPGLSQCNMIP